MAARRAAPDQRGAKILLGVLGLVLLGVCGFWGARYLVHRNASAAPATPAAAPAAAAQPVALTLRSQLRSFSGLRSRDVFEAQASNETSPAATTPAPPAAAPPPPPAQTIAIAPPAAQPAQPKGPLLPAALLRLNGTRQVVVVGAAFPRSKPTFRLTAVGRSAMWIGLLHGSFGDGRQLLKVVHGRPAKLVGSGGGRVSFLLALVRVTARHVPPAPSRSTTTAATTTPFSISTAPTTTTAAAPTGP